jgi:hypothetical protein
VLLSQKNEGQKCNKNHIKNAVFKNLSDFSEMGGNPYACIQQAEQ